MTAARCIEDRRNSAEFQDDRLCHEFRSDDVPGGAAADKDWTKLLKKWSHYKNGPGVKLLNLIKKGVPDDVRPNLWKRLLEIDPLKASTHFCYPDEVAKLRDHLTSLNVTEYNTDRAEQQLGHIETYECLNDSRLAISGQPSVQNLRQILLDVGRTFSTHPLFMGESAEAIEGRASLFRILAVYARFDPRVGYCQGMSFIAGMLVTVLSEEDSFWCMVALMQKPKYLHGYFDATLSRVRMHAEIFDRLLKQRRSLLWRHLRSHNVDPLMYITPWLMCLFTSLPCRDVVLGIWDLILLEGFAVVFRVALAIMEVLAENFLSETDGNRLILILQRPPSASMNRDRLLPVVWRTSVDLWELHTTQAVIDEESEDGDSTTIDRAPSSSSSRVPNTFGWQRLRKRKDDEPSLLSKIAKMFNAKSQKRKNPMILVTESTPAKSTETARRCPLLDVNSRTTTHQRDSQLVTATSDSTSENLYRIRRLVSGNKSCTQSVESLGKGVDYVADCGARHMQAFGAFSHPVPLRQNQRSRTSLLVTRSCTSPEMELRCMSANHADARTKRRRHSIGAASSPDRRREDDEWATPQAPSSEFRKNVKKRRHRPDAKKRFRHLDDDDDPDLGSSGGDGHE